LIIEVYRGDGLRVGPPITESLLSDEALLQRGIAEMDAHASAFNHIEMEVVFRQGVRLGQLIEVSDPSDAHAYRAKVTGVQISVTQAEIQMRLNLEQPR